MLETQNMLRSDTTALFERLREANILLQEVLSGAHENMSEIESTLVTRVSDFVAAMNEVAQKTGVGEQPRWSGNIASFQTHDRPDAQATSTQLASQFDAHGRSLAEAVALIDTSNRRTEGDRWPSGAHALEQLVAALDSKSNDLEQRLTRFASVLDQSLEGARREPRARDDRAGCAGDRDLRNHRTDRAERKRRSSRAEHVYEAIRKSCAEEERKRTTRRQTSTCHGALTMQRCYMTEESSTMFAQAAERFADVLEGLKRMACRDAARARSDPQPSCARAFSNCRRRPPTAPRRCAASSSTRSRRWPNSTASSPATAAASTRSSRLPAASRRSRPAAPSPMARERRAKRRGQPATAAQSRAHQWRPAARAAARRAPTSPA